MSVQDEPEYYYNLSTGRVEEGKQSSGLDRMGPYATRGEAEQALQIAQERNEAADEAERAWDADD